MTYGTQNNAGSRQAQESSDTLFFFLRALFFIGALAWTLAIYTQISRLTHFQGVPQKIAPLLFWFLLYSIFFHQLVRRFPAQKSVSYIVMMILDIVFVTLLIFYTGHGRSSFYLGYCLFIAAYALAFGTFTGAAATMLSASLYLSLYMFNADKYFAADFGANLSFMFLVFFVVAAMTEKEKRDKQRIAEDKRKIDELHGQLEDKFTELMDEKEAVANASRDKSAVIRKMAEITERRQSHIAFSKELNSKKSVQEAVLLFSRYLCSLLDVSGVAIVVTNPELKTAVAYRATDRQVHSRQVSFGHPVLNAVRSNPDMEFMWNSGDAGEDEGNIPHFADLLPDGFSPAMVYASPIISENVDDAGIYVIFNSEPVEFDRELMEEISILSNHLGIDIQKIKYSNKLQDLADTDGLTGIYNHRFFQQQLDEELARARRYKRPVSFIIFDIDFFKKLNDTHGHPAGDAVLREISSVVRTSLRNIDMLARYGGEEFAVILPETPCDGAVIVAERIRALIEEHEFPAGDGKKLNITVSIGVASHPENQDKASLIQSADQALYRAKQAGRNRVMV